MTTIKQAGFIAVLLLGSLSSLAASADTTINFVGNLIIPDCVINDGNPILVDFGNVEIQTLTAANTAYSAKDFAIPMNCPYILKTPQLTMTSSAVYDAASGTIRTSKDSEGLVVYLRQGGGKVISLGTATDVSSSVTGSGTRRTLTLNAALGYYKTQEDLTAGPFRASASLQVRYQ